MELIDTHCHLDVPDFDADREEVLARCRSRQITGIVVPGVEAAGWDGLTALCRREKGLFPALGLHPIYLEQHRPQDLEDLERRLERERPVAVGEIGLDFYVSQLDRARQQALFDTQLEMAREFNLPVLLHVRKAHDQVLAMVRRSRVRGGIAHAFNGSVQQAWQYIDLGFKLGFGGMLTYDRSTKLRRLARELPLGAIVLETDAPDMTVAAHRGERNSPEYLPDCLAALAEARSEDPERVAEQTTANAREILDLRSVPDIYKFSDKNT
jgi:TatD DNase family protein